LGSSHRGRKQIWTALEGVLISTSQEKKKVVTNLPHVPFFWRVSKSVWVRKLKGKKGRRQERRMREDAGKSM
jgi:hypothetical protein